MHPDDLRDAIGRATKAANRARVLPHRWVAVAVECGGGRWYVVVLGWSPRWPLAAVYRVRPDLRLRRIVRPPWNLPKLARTKVGTIPLLEADRPGQYEGWLMTSTRLEQRARCGSS